LPERTYSFRAAEDLGDRIHEASETLERLAEAHVVERFVRDLGLAIFRESGRFNEVRGNQSAFVRETVELLLSAAEKTATDLEYAEAYSRVAADRTTDEEAVHRAARARAAERWRDD
jgi:hypothetical protein